ncbi:Hpt domain-containing protein [Intestinibacillus massiliensis]|uniref:Hpt domain-containing protein n=1 Tax=Intestinibacillus massiliensis TaxID=1871029 RepID=UPI000B3519EF|nr:Hpt domain-containing protein [Intestinibacillus massiliensis]
MDLNELITRAGGDYEQTLRRFAGNEAIMHRFALKFPQDPSFQEMAEGVARKDYPLVERAAHTMKGTAANLGFQALSDCSAALVLAVREGDYSSADSRFETVKGAYLELIGWIGALA